ncbi:hypothetical protein ABZY44_35920 [Streptomyces sp. NPDC006544]|uniref:hypothetical protein n=1 Tax=Streptomyces sp. NPDC006544 TaxID=3154583 RepID=UPI0033A34552
MYVRKLFAVVAATAALLGGMSLGGAAQAAAQPSGYGRQARAAGLTEAQAGRLQNEVDAYLAAHAGARQISANRLATGFGAVTLTAPGQSEARDLAAPGAALACGSGHLCITDGRGSFYDYYYCGLYGFGGVGVGSFNNNQTWGTTAWFYNSDGSVRFYHTAKGSSGGVDWTPVFSIRPC